MTGWVVRFDRKASKDLGRLGAEDRSRVLAFLEDRLAKLPGPRHLGGPLHGELASYWKYRVGDIRVVAEIRDGDLVILVVQIGNRRGVYR